jgi:cysteinyl-tRNA synthetase
MVEGAKMSKSAGNFYTLADLIDRGVAPVLVRFELLRAPYRQNANFTFKGLEDADRQVRRFGAFAGERPANIAAPAAAEQRTDIERTFAEALSDDLNISAALGELNKWIHATPEPTEADRAAMWRIDAVLGVLEPGAEPRAGDDDDAAIDAKVRRLDQARAKKDYATSDAIRDELAGAGIEVQIGRTGSTWRRKMNL